MIAKRAPWKRANPRKRAGKASKHLSPAAKAAAKAKARRAGRRYPNLVDNMRAASKKKTKKSSSPKKRVGRKRAAHKTAPRKRAKKTKKAKRKPTRKAAEKDPRGGLTAVGRRAFAKSEGAHLKPGVTKKVSDMSPAEMRRKGSWAVRFYGRAKLPPLVDANGKPTRHALSAHAWGEPVPRTVAAARRIAAKGKRLLARYRAAKEAKRG